LSSGNSEKIWIEKGEHKIVFDIRIETPEGLIFALHHKQNKLVEKSMLQGQKTSHQNVEPEGPSNPGTHERRHVSKDMQGS
jgi:hypothetical protein